MIAYPCKWRKRESDRLGNTLFLRCLHELVPVDRCRDDLAALCKHYEWDGGAACSRCGGTGEVTIPTIHSCPECSGREKIPVGYQLGDMVVLRDAPNVVCRICEVMEGVATLDPLEATCVGIVQMHVHNLIPVHRCPTVVTILEQDEGESDEEKIYYIPNPSGSPGEPFTPCPEMFYPMDTWCLLKEEHNSSTFERIHRNIPAVIERVDLVLDSILLYIEVEPHDRRFMNKDILEARVSSKAVECPCGQWYTPPRRD